MARRRMIDPEFWLDEGIAKLSPYARLLYIGSWCIADDHAHTFPYRPEWIKAQLFPYETVNVVALIKELSDAKKYIVFISESDNRNYIYVKNFHKHQRIEKPSKQKYPNYTDKSRVIVGEELASGKLPVGEQSGRSSGDTDIPLINIDLGKENSTQSGSSGGVVGDQSESTPAKVKLSKVKLSKEKVSKGNDTVITTDDIKPTITEERRQPLIRELTLLQGVSNYPYDEEIDVPMLEGLKADHPTLNLFKQLDKWKYYLMGSPLKIDNKGHLVSHPRAQIKNWFQKGEEFKEEADEKRNNIVKEGEIRVVDGKEQVLVDGQWRTVT